LTPPRANVEARPSVEVRSGDPVSQAGVTSLLRDRPEVHLHKDADQHPTVIVVVVDGLDAAGLQLLRTARQSTPARLVLIVTRLADEQLALATDCGVVAVIWRAETTADALVRAIRTAARGDGRLPADLLGRLLTRIGQSDGQYLLVRELSDREIDVLRLIAGGWDTASIAQKLSYSQRTVKNILFAMTTRYALRNRAHAVAFAMRRGLI
jgi:DNA-binding NarL/FixJ family response regulator